MYTVLHSPECQQLLGLVAVDETVNGEHQIEKSRAQCDCGRVLASVKTHELNDDEGKMFQVNCGAW